MVTIKDISAKCGVSIATVSKALNGYGDVSKATVEKVRKVAEELHYRPNPAARQLKTNRSYNIGVVFEDETMSGLTHHYFSHILNSAKNEMENNGYDITFIGQRIGGSFLEHCQYRKVDGVLIACVDFQQKSVVELMESGIPVVTIDFPFAGHPCVISDNEVGGYQLTKYLLDMGHRRIAFLHGEKNDVTNKRLEGFHRALDEYGVSVPDRFIREARYHDAQLSASLTDELMENRNDLPTAIMYPDDFSALGGLNELDKLGFSIPSDVSVAGYDGIDLSQAIRPRLTTYRQDAEEIGRVSGQRLIRNIEGNDTGEEEQILITGHLLEGESVRNII